MIKKRLVAFLLCALMVLSLAGCGNGKTSASVMEVSGIAIPEGVFNYYFAYGKAGLANYGIDADAAGNEQFLSIIEEQTVEIMNQLVATRLAAQDLGIETDKKAVKEQIDSLKQSLDQTVEQEKATLAQMEEQLKQMEEQEAQKSENNDAGNTENKDNAAGDSADPSKDNNAEGQPAGEAGDNAAPNDDKAKLQEQIKELKADIKKDPFKRFLEEYNMSDGDLNWLIETIVLNEAVQKELTKDITVTDEEAQAEYDANKDSYDTMNFSHILIKVDEGATEAQWAEAEKKAKDLIAQLNDGADFATLAKENSADGSAQDGGKLNQEVTKATSPYVPEFTEAGFQLAKEGDFTKTPVKTQFGYHIIKADTAKKGFDKVKDDVKEALLQTKQQEVVNAYYENLKKDLKVTKEYEYKYAKKDDQDNSADGQNDANAGDDTTGGENENSGGDGQQQPQAE